jgi:hypothetical protein
MPNVLELHRWVAEYNWDDGLAAIWPVVNDGQIEFATALMIYWRLGGPYLEAESGAVGADARRLLAMVRQGILAGVYPKGMLRYDPIEDNRLTKPQVYKLTRGGLPADLICPKYPGETNTADDVA